MQTRYYLHLILIITILLDSSSSLSGMYVASVTIIPDGNYQQVRCIYCPAGTYSAGGINMCQPCEPGYFANSGNVSSSHYHYHCYYYYHHHEGYSECLPCPGGSFNVSPNADNCFYCEPGKYSDPGIYPSSLSSLSSSSL